jgi:prepilin-type N-terminal cleavage/methylation domain-containing protein
MNGSRGFTLLELAIVLVIIGILSAVIVKTTGVLRGAESANIVATVKDLRAAIAVFRERYHYLPGDFPVDATNPEIGAKQGVDKLSVDCTIGGTNAGNGNGLISDRESACVNEMLIRAGLIRGDPKSAMIWRNGFIRIVSASEAGLASIPTDARNVILFTNIPCDSVARAVDSAQDDGNETTGRIRTSERCDSVPNKQDNLVTLAVGL